MRFHRTFVIRIIRVVCSHRGVMARLVVRAFSAHVPTPIVGRTMALARQCNANGSSATDHSCAAGRVEEAVYYCDKVSSSDHPA